MAERSKLKRSMAPWAGLESELPGAKEMLTQLLSGSRVLYSSWCSFWLGFFLCKRGPHAGTGDQLARLHRFLWHCRAQARLLCRSEIFHGCNGNFDLLVHPRFGHGSGQRFLQLHPGPIKLAVQGLQPL